MQFIEAAVTGQFVGLLVLCVLVAAAVSFGLYHYFGRPALEGLWKTLEAYGYPVHRGYDRMMVAFRILSALNVAVGGGGLVWHIQWVGAGGAVWPVTDLHRLIVALLATAALNFLVGYGLVYRFLHQHDKKA